MKKNILITGASSFVAKNLIKNFNKKNYLLTLSDIKTDHKSKNFIISDLNKLKINHIKSKKVDHIIHLGAVSTAQNFANNIKKSYETNILSILNILEIAKAKKSKTIIFASSEWVYGQKTNRSQKENDIVDVETLGSSYALSKRVGEDFLKYYCTLYNIKLIILRFGIIYGNKDVNLCAVESIFKSLKDNNNEITVGSLKSSRRFIHVSDICAAIFKSLKLETNQVLNISGDEIISMKDIIEISSQILKIKPNIIEQDKNNISVRNPSNSKAKKILGWKPKMTLKKGLISFNKYLDEKSYKKK
tara:strand:+ start:2770 stop:3678 length:909 start_codon:yes stop_codon:yes gene_type:complete